MKVLRKFHKDEAFKRQKNPVCNVCDKSFSQNVGMKGHIASVHQGKKPFKCEVCARDFTEKQKSKNHTA